jgi:hypothetical protein
MNEVRISRQLTLISEMTFFVLSALFGIRSSFSASEFLAIYITRLEMRRSSSSDSETRSISYSSSSS